MSDVPVQVVVAAFKDEHTASEALKALRRNTLGALPGIYSEDPYKNFETALGYAHQLGQFGEMLETQGVCLVNPGVQEGDCELFVGQIPKGAKILFEQVSGVKGFIELHEHHESLEATGVEAFQGIEQQEPAAFDELFVRTTELAGHNLFWSHR